jgi:hypothetical protein
MSEERDLTAYDAKVQEEYEVKHLVEELHELLGHVLFGEFTESSTATLATIRALRAALGYLEGHYARQIGGQKQARADAAERATKRKPGAKRGRPRKANGTPPPEPAPSSLPFGPGPAAEA